MRRLPMVCLLFAFLLAFPLALGAAAPLPAPAAEGYADINANPPLRAAILANYSLPDQPFTDVLSDSLYALNMLNYKKEIDLSAEAVERYKDRGYMGASMQLESLSGISVLDDIGARKLNISGQPALFTTAYGTWAQIKGLKGLTELRADGCAITTLAYIGSSRLDSLSLADNALRSATGITAFSNLKALDISGNRITDFSPLTGLGRLESLSIGGAKPASYGFLKDMPGLNYLSIARGSFTDSQWHCLAPLANLGELHLNDNHLTTALPLFELRDAGKLPGLRSISLARNYIPDLAINRPYQLSGISLISESFKQYEVVFTQGGRAIGSLSLRRDTVIGLGRRFIGETDIHEAQPSAIAVEGGNIAASTTGSGISLSPRMNGTARLKAYPADGPEDACAQIPVTVSGGTLAARLEMAAEGRSVYKDYTGLFAGAELELPIPTREECEAMFKMVGIDMEDFDIPSGSAKVVAGNAAVAHFPRIADGSVTLIHRAEDGTELSRGVEQPLRSGSYSYSPRNDIPGYAPATGPAEVRIGYSNRHAEVVFIYRKAGDARLDALKALPRRVLPDLEKMTFSTHGLHGK